jgi:hypothetical protein
MSILIIHVKNSMQTNYSYTRERAAGDMSDHPEFQPVYTPLEMLRMGVFEGRYLDPNSDEYPEEWREHMMYFSTEKHNYFGVKSRQPLSAWRENGWIDLQDPRGWFEWYCRFWLGRRSRDDHRQIMRWRSFGARHSGQILKNCPGDLNKRLRQRQGLLQWSWNPFI